MRGLDAGRVRLRLAIKDGRVSAADISCERPDIASTLVGRPAREAVTLVPLIYSLCSTAQRTAANRALDAAYGSQEIRYFDAGVAAEAMREHASKLLIEWPRHFGGATDEKLFVRIAKASQEKETTSLVAALRNNEVIDQLKEQAKRNPAGYLLGECIAGRLTGLLDLLSGNQTRYGMVEAFQLGRKRGKAIVETARGKLAHEISVSDELIQSYDIDAPTDRLFNQDGPIPKLLVGTKATDAHRIAELAVLALDPCVPYEVS